MASNRFNFSVRTGSALQREDVRETHLTLPAEKEFKLVNAMTGNVPLSFSVEQYYGEPWAPGGNDLMYAQKVRWLGDYEKEDARNRLRSTLIKQSNRAVNYYKVVYGEKAVAPDKGALLEQSVYNALKNGEYDSAYSMAKGHMNERLVRAFMRAPIHSSNNPHYHFEQTSMVQGMLGRVADKSAFMTQGNRSNFYKMFIANAAEEERKKLEFYMYLDMYGCVIYSYLMGVLNTAEMPMTDAQHKKFVDLLYDNASTIFSATNFDRSYGVNASNVPWYDPKSKNIGVNRSVLTDGTLLGLISEAMDTDLSYVEVTNTPNENTRFGITKDSPDPNMINSHKVLNFYVQKPEGGQMGVMFEDPLMLRRQAANKKSLYENTAKFTPYDVYFGTEVSPKARKWYKGMEELANILAK